MDCSKVPPSILVSFIDQELRARGIILPGLHYIYIDSTQLLDAVASIYVQLSQMSGELFSMDPLFSVALQTTSTATWSTTSVQPLVSGVPQIIEQIPYTHMNTSRLASPASITFTVNGRQGVSLNHLLDDTIEAALDNAHDTPLHSRGKKVTYRLQIQGYPVYSKQRTVRHDTKLEWRSRIQIAVQIAHVVRDYIDNYGSLGHLTINGDSVHFSQIALLELHQVLDATWVPVLGRIL